MKRMLVLAAWLVCLAGYPSLSYSQAGPAVHLKASNGQYVVAEGGGGGVVNANRSAAGPWETFTLIDKNGSPLMNGDAVNFKTATGHFLVAEGSGGREVLANRTAAGPWETFAIVKVRGSTGQEIVHGDAIALRASNGQYVVAEGGGGGVVNANRNAIGAWETFVLEVVGGAAPPPPPPSVAVPGATPAPAQPGPGIGPARPPLRPGFPGAISPTPTPAPAPQPPGIQVPGRRPPIPVQPVEPDNRPPGPAPTGLTPTAPGPTTVNLRWNAAANAIGYLIQRGTELLTQAPINALTYTDSGRLPKTAYSYTVAAVYPQTGPYSPGWSAPVNVATPPILPPENLKITVTGPSSIAATWAPRQGASAYIVWRDSTRLAKVPTTSYTDQGIPPGSYTYAVAADYGPQVGESNRGPAATVTFISGFADTHNHQFAHLGFGGLFVWGKTFDPGGMDKALPWCGSLTQLVPHGPAGLGDVMGYLMTGPLGLKVKPLPGHAVGGYPQFDGWPRWNSITHQQMYYEWLKRAHDGGLQLMVMFAVNSEFLCCLVNHPLGCDDMQAVDRQLAAAKALEAFVDQQSGGPGKGWYRIVRSSQEAREAINNGKLAVVLGIEVPDLFGCAQAPAQCNQSYVQTQLDKYYNLGVRHLFTIHSINNAFGGTALFQDVYNVSNRVLTGSWLAAQGCPYPGVEYHLSGGMGGLIQALTTQLPPGLPPDALCPTLRAHLSAATQGAVGFELPIYPSGGHCNPMGLTPLGRWFVGELMRRHMIVDIDHMSWRAVNDALAIAKANNYYPVMSGHAGFIETSIGDKKRYEAQKNGELVNGIYELGGMVGVITAQGSTDDIAPWGNKVPNDCGQSSKTFAQAYLFAVERSGGPSKAAVALGTDFMGGINQPGPRFGGNDACGGNAGQRAANQSTRQVTYPFSLPGTSRSLGQSVVGERTFDYNVDGLAHVGLLPDFIQDLRMVGLTDEDLNPLLRSAEGYIQMWERAERRTRAVSAPPAPPLFVQVAYGSRTAAGGTVTVFAADWKTGVGVQGQVKLDTGGQGAIGAPITYQYNVGPTGQLDPEGNPVLDNSGQPVTGPLPIAGLVTAVNYPNVSFEIPPPRLSLKVRRTELITAANRTVTVTATVDLTGAAVTTGTVTINGRTGQLGQPITYPSCKQTEVVEKTTGKPGATRITTPIPCTGMVVAPGFEPAFFDDSGS